MSDSYREQLDRQMYKQIAEIEKRARKKRMTEIDKRVREKVSKRGK